MITYQEFKATYKDGLPTAAGVESVVMDHKASDEYQLALIADEYDRQKNATIMQYEKYIHTMTGASIVDPYAANHKIPSNMFRRLNVQRTQYSLGNGLSFRDKKVKDRFGKEFDATVQKIGYAANIHGLAFGFWNLDGIYGANLLLNKDFGKLVVFDKNEIKAIPLSETAGKLKFVDPECEVVSSAKKMGITFGE